MDREQLLASLLLTVDRDAVGFGDNAYIDWSVENGDGTRRVTVGNEGGDTTTLDLTLDQIVRLQQALTVFVLEH